MGLAKQAMLEDDGFSDFLKEVLNGEGLDDAAAGITKKVIADGGSTELLSGEAEVCVQDPGHGRVRDAGVHPVRQQHSVVGDVRRPRQRWHVQLVRAHVEQGRLKD